MEVTRKPTKNKILKFDEHEYERVKKFKNLATIETENNYITAEIK
jgi:hypothetical protein